MSLFRKWKTEHQEYFDRTPCRFWPPLTFDFRASGYGPNQPFIISGGEPHVVKMNIRKLREMKARGVEIGEFRVMSGHPDVLSQIGKYHTYIVGWDRLVIVSMFGNITCKEVKE